MACNCNSNNPGQVSEINTATNDCGTTQTCTPQTYIAPTAACSCGCSSCQCQQSGLATPLPFYNQVPECQESHTQVLVNQNFTTSISVGYPFNMPDCNNQISISLPGVQLLQVGAYLWNASYGYLKVISFDFATAHAVVENECQADNAAPGTEIPSCTLFNVVDPPFELTPNCGEGVWVTSDFVAPVLNGTVDIDVTSTVGLLINRDVQVGVGVYLLESILTANLIRIKNNGGAGIVPGATISAYDVDGNCITPVTLYITDICNSIAATPGSIVICDGAGNITTLEATAVGQIPVCTDATNNLFEAQLADIPVIICTTLDACLTLISGTNTYVLVVVDSSEFAIGEVIRIQDPQCDSVLWVVTNVPDGTHIHIESIEPNTLDVACLDVGTLVCHGTCCEQNSYDIGHVCNQDWSSAQDTAIVAQQSADSAITVNPGGSHSSASTAVTFVNNTCNDMHVLIALDFHLSITVNIDENAWTRMFFTPKFGSSTIASPGVPAVPVLVDLTTRIDEHVYGVPTAQKCKAWDAWNNLSYNRTVAVTIPANTVYRCDAAYELEYDSYHSGTDSCCPCGSITVEGTGVCTIQAGWVFINGIGTALQSA